MPVADHISDHGLLYFPLPLAAYPFPHALSLAADKAVSMQQGLCYRSLGSGTCTLPLVQRITKQICCCSRVGKAWGSKCEQCPLPGTGNHLKVSDHFPSLGRPLQVGKLSLPSIFQTWDSFCSHSCLVPLREERGPWFLTGMAWLN